MVSVIQKTLCNSCVKPWKSQSGPQAVAILSSLSSISLLKISIIPLLLYSLHVQHLTFYLILFLFFFPIKLINQPRTNPTSEKKKKKTHSTKWHKAYLFHNSYHIRQPSHIIFQLVIPFYQQSVILKQMTLRIFTPFLILFYTLPFPGF